MRGLGYWLLRRLVMVPLIVVLTTLFAALTVGSLLVGVLAWPVLVARGRRARWRPIRVTALALAYLVADCLIMVISLLLWVASGFGWRLRAPWVVRAHLALLTVFLGGLVALARPLFGFRLVVDEPRRHPEDLLRAEESGPLLVLARHAGPGASFALVHLLIARYHRHPLVVLKEQLRLDPAVDLLLTRIGCAWVPTTRGKEDAAERVGRAAAALGPRQALVLFPEGADWTPLRHLKAVARLRRRGLVRQAQQALRMPHVLPPRPAGALAALQGAPDADVLVFTHTGHDELLDAAAAWRALPLSHPLHMMWWREPAGQVPRDDAEAVGVWLQQTWSGIDAWVSEQIDLAALRP